MKIFAQIEQTRPGHAHSSGIIQQKPQYIHFSSMARSMLFNAGVPTRRRRMFIILQIFSGILLADFASGLVHWLEDNYGAKTTPLVGGAINANILHHSEPRKFLRNNWWNNSRAILPFVVFFSVVFYMTGQLNIFTLTFLLIGWNANEIHKWSHQTEKERPLIANWLQKLGIVQSPKQHNIHHGGNKDSSYCTVTVILNPILNTIKFWRGAEWLVFKLTRVKTRPDPTIKHPMARP